MGSFGRGAAPAPHLAPQWARSDRAARRTTRGAAPAPRLATSGERDEPRAAWPTTWPRGGDSRRGFTLVELVVMGSIGLFVAGVIWYLVVSFSRQSEKLDVRLRGFQSAQLVLQRMREDLAGYYHVSEDVSLVGLDPPRLSFYAFQEYAYDPEAPAQASVQVQRINYLFDPEEHILRRNNEALRLARFEKVRFEHVRPDVPPGTMASSLGSYIRIRLTYVPEEKLGGPVGDQDRATHEAVISLPHRTAQDAYALWPPNPFDRTMY